MNNGITVRSNLHQSGAKSTCSGCCKNAEYTIEIEKHNVNLQGTETVIRVKTLELCFTCLQSLKRAITEVLASELY